MPIFLFGGHDERILSELKMADAVELITSKWNEIAEALETVAMPEGMERSSMNDIGARAKAIVRAMREKQRQDKTSACDEGA